MKDGGVAKTIPILVRLRAMDEHQIVWVILRFVQSGGHRGLHDRVEVEYWERATGT